MPNTKNMHPKVFKKSPTKVKSRRNYSEPHYERRLIAGVAAAQKTKEGIIVEIQNVFTGKLAKCTNPHQVAKELGIPSSTLNDHMSGKRRFVKDTWGQGRSSLLSSKLENEIARFATILCDKGFGVNWTDIRFIAYKIANDPNSPNCVPGFQASWGWLKKFQKRHPALTQRVAENLDRQRAGALNPDTIKYYFTLLAAVIQVCEKENKRPMTADLIMNLDETGFDQANVSKTGVVTMKSRRSATQKRRSANRTHMTACVCIVANGDRLPTMYALKGKCRPKFLVNCDETVGWVMTEKGYFDDEAFYQYALHIVKFIPQDEMWRVMILDGFGSHIMCHCTLYLFRSRRIHIVCMPSHTSSLLQPLDVSCFGPVKDKFQMDLCVVQTRDGTMTVRNAELPGIFKVSLQFGCTPTNIKNRFIACGIWPLSTTWMKRNRKKLAMAKDLHNDKMARLTPEEATHFEMEDMVQGLCTMLSEAINENYENDGMLPATVEKVNT